MSQRTMIERLNQVLYPCLFLALLSCGVAQQDTEEIIGKARSKMDGGSFKEAISLLDKVLVENPKNVEALNMRGVANVNLESFGKALSDFDAAIRLDEQNYMFFYNRGNVKRKLKQPDAAVQDYSKALALDSSHYEVWLNRALAYVGSGKPEKAQSDFKQAVSKGGDKDPQVYFYMGRLMIGLGSFQEGLEAAQKCISLNKNHAPGHYMMALALLGVGKPVEEACSHAQTSLDLGYESAQGFIAQYCSEADIDDASHEGHGH